MEASRQRRWVPRLTIVMVRTALIIRMDVAATFFMLCARGLTPTTLGRGGGECDGGGVGGHWTPPHPLLPHSLPPSSVGGCSNLGGSAKKGGRQLEPPPSPLLMPGTQKNRSKSKSPPTPQKKGIRRETGFKKRPVAE